MPGWPAQKGLEWPAGLACQTGAAGRPGAAQLWPRWAGATEKLEAACTAGMRPALPIRSCRLKAGGAGRERGPENWGACASLECCLALAPGPAGQGGRAPCRHARNKKGSHKRSAADRSAQPARRPSAPSPGEGVAALRLRTAASWQPHRTAPRQQQPFPVCQDSACALQARPRSAAAPNRRRAVRQRPPRQDHLGRWQLLCLSRLWALPWRLGPPRRLPPLARTCQPAPSSCRGAAGSRPDCPPPLAPALACTSQRDLPTAWWAQPVPRGGRPSEAERPTGHPPLPGTGRLPRHPWPAARGRCLPAAGQQAGSGLQGACRRSSGALGAARPGRQRSGSRARWAC